MIGITVDKRGLLQLRADAAAMDRDIRAAIRDLAREYLGKVRAELARPKSGRSYGDRAGRVAYKAVRKRVEILGKKRTVTRKERVRGNRARRWRASAPGEAPAVFTGNLLRGLRMAFPGAEKGFGAKVFASRGLAPHRQLLEFGTGRFRIARGGRGKGEAAKTHLEPRPIWTPFQERALVDLEKRVLAVIDASIAYRGGA